MKDKEQVFYQELYGECWKALISPYGSTLKFDLRLTPDGTYSIRYGSIDIFDTKKEAKQAVQEYKNQRP